MKTSLNWIAEHLRMAAQTNYKKSNDGIINSNRWIGEKWAYGMLSGQIHSVIMECIGTEMDNIRQTDGADVAQIAGDKYCSIFTLEWPFEKNGDPGRILYFRSIEDGRNNKPSEMKLGAYIHQHFPGFTGDQIETLVRMHIDKNKLYFKIVTNKELVASMYNTNAHSCMHPCQNQWRDREYHPYAAYTSRLGWAMAIRTDAKGVGQSRCIIRPDEKTFIRIYGSSNGQHTTIGDDPALRKWLIDAGYELVNSWEGKALEKILIPNKKNNGQPCYVGPYLDGSVKKAKMKKDDDTVMVITADGNWDMANTNGFSYMTHPDREGMVRIYGGDWARPEDTVAGIHGNIYLRSEVEYIERQHDYIPISDCVTVNGIREHVNDCCAVSYITDENTLDEKYVLNIEGNTVIRVKDGCYYRYASKEDVALDYQGNYQFKARMVEMTGGSFKGKLALVTRTCTRIKDGLIVLTHLCRTNYTLNDRQWTPMPGDQVKMTDSGIHYIENDLPDNELGDKIGVLTQDCEDGCYGVRYEQYRHVVYFPKREHFELVCLAKTRPVEIEPWKPAIGDYVFLTRKTYEYYSESEYNPFGIIGQIDSQYGDNWGVQWSNGNHNVYAYADCFRKATKDEIIAVYGEHAECGK